MTFMLFLVSFFLTQNKHLTFSIKQLPMHFQFAYEKEEEIFENAGVLQFGAKSSFCSKIVFVNDKQHVFET